MGDSDDDHDMDNNRSSEESSSSEQDHEDDLDDDEENDDSFNLGNDPNLLGQLVHELEERETSDRQSTRQTKRSSQTPEILLSPTRTVTRKRQQATPLSQVREASRTPTRVTTRSQAKRVTEGGGKEASITPVQRTKRARQKSDILDGLDAAREVFSQNVRDPIKRVYQAVDAEFPRQEPPTPSPRPVPRSRPATRPSDVFTSDEEEVRETVARRDCLAEQKARKRAERGRKRRERERARVIATPRPNASPTGNTRTIAAPADPRRMLEVSGARSPSVTSSGGTGPRRRRMWTRQDEEELERGLEKHQYHTRRWRLILDEGKAKGLFQGRHNVDLNNKARQMKEARLKAGLPLGGFEYALDRHLHT
ncbi:uncharacterized protein SPPG_04570 [Spizellomyces punctatus DAOM BR117]|uniref:Uncharacterized protein n=1 Tax=Spizellomyces punctatus (strain DAOM BR117) TaxID=645134 RepID=A0A0L0HGM7_SPIPD|nr:uncharacterized protein SPPG_04570 [Spizellomyces punctatus DAOM BR117]KND00238.1 hypothetical protein SPPG_04570 [Spizellomyces punctatus DAOM BR117]|eukprot:XP_016608277.1 hypothetical protein SPPG_04570 [Spizellomyces punctatus DAOM BR117]